MARMISILLILLMASPAWAFPPVMMGKASAGGAAAGCPSWGTYGTSDGQILFAWNGLHASGNAVACLSSGTVTGTNTSGGEFISDGDGTYWRGSTTGEQLLFAVDAAKVDVERAGGVTIWVKFRSASFTGARYLIWMMGDANDFVRMGIDVDDKPSIFWDGNGTTDSATETTATTDASINTVAFSWATHANNGAANPDIAALTGTSWAGAVTSNGDLADWSGAVSELTFGDPSLNYNNPADTALDIFSVVVIAGFEQACPW